MLSVCVLQRAALTLAVCYEDKCVYYVCVRSIALLLVRSLHSRYHRNALRECYNRDFYWHSNLCSNAGTGEISMKLRGCLKDKLRVKYYPYTRKDENKCILFEDPLLTPQ